MAEIYKMENAIKKLQCTKFETCSAALCPLDLNPRRCWYADTEICSRSKLPWVKIQKKIQKINPDPKRYFTQKMLESIKRVWPGIKGIECFGYHKPTEQKWLHDRRFERCPSKIWGNYAGFSEEKNENSGGLFAE